MPLESAMHGYQPKYVSLKRAELTLFYHLLDCACRVYFHGKKVVKSIHLGSILRELLSKGIR